MNLTIKFTPGYYEWHLLLNDVLVYVNGDSFADEMGELSERTGGEWLYSDAESVVSNLVSYIRYDFLKNVEYGDENASYLTDEAKSILESLTDKEWDAIEQEILRSYCTCNPYNICNRITKFNNVEFEPVGNLLGGEHLILEAKTSDVAYNNGQEFNEIRFRLHMKVRHAYANVYRIIGDYETLYMLVKTGDKTNPKILFYPCNITNLKSCKFKPCSAYQKKYSYSN